MSQPEFLEKNRSLKEINWWRVGGTAEFFALPKTIEELKAAWHWAWQNKKKIWVMSGGSNILMPDGELKGLLISLHELKGITKIETGADILIQCMAGTPKSELAKYFLQNRLPPAVFLMGIPGDMGAGVVMNAGIGENRTPREFCEIVKHIIVLRIDESSGVFSLHTIAGHKIKWEYRHSSGWQPGIIVEVAVGCPNMPDLQVPQSVREQTKKRVSTQPLDLPNCGSVFRNPLGHKSAQLIESCGLKGFRVGGASISLKHANFIVNDRGAASGDIKKIIDHVRETVFAQKGVSLVSEVVFLGE